MGNRRIIISESEKRRIKNLYETPVSLDFVISDWLSPDEKYVIFLDELYDIESKTKLGNIWENFDNFKFFLKHSFQVSTTVPQQIKEDVLKTLDSFLLTESTQNLTMLKPIFKQLLNEDWGLLGDLGNWVKDTAVGTFDNTVDFVKTSWDGIQKAGIAISQGDWSRVLDLLKKGALYVARKIRAALYHPVGLILDAILMASGVGIGFKMLPWAVAVGLDVYEFITGDYEDPDLSIGWRLLFFGTDILGLVIAGVAAKGPRVLVTNLISKYGKTGEGLSMAAKESKEMKGFLGTVLNSSSKVVSLIEKSLNYLKDKSPMLYKFLSGIMGGLKTFLTKLVNIIKSILRGVANVVSAPGKLTTKLGAGKKTAAAANMFVPSAVVGTIGEKLKKKSEEEVANAIKNSSVKSEYDANQLYKK